MPIELTKKADGRAIHIRVKGRLTEGDYEKFVPQVEDLIKRYGKIRVLFEMEDFHGWTASALWEDLKFDLAHFKDIDRLAMVGEKKWQKGMAIFCKPFTTATIKYFESNQLEQALDWIEAGLPAENRAGAQSS